MKHQPLAALLVALLFVSGLLTVWISLRYYFSAKELQQIQVRYVQINNTRNAVQSLANEAVEYSKKHPDLDPILQEFDLKPGTGTNQPTPKPAAR